MNSLVSRWRRAPAWLLAISGGLLAALAHPTADAIQPLAGTAYILPGVALLFAALDRTHTAKTAFAVGWLAGAAHFAVVFHWIAYPFLVKADSHLWALPFAVALLPSGLACLWGGAFSIARRAWPAGSARAATFAVCLSAAEWLRGVLFSGFPWALPGYVWMDTPLQQLLSVLGIHGLTVLTLFIPALGMAILSGDSAPRRRRGLRNALAVALPFCLIAAGWWTGARMAHGEIEPADGTPTLRLVQPNIPQQEKWRRTLRTRNFERLAGLSYTEGEERPDLVIWPESAAPAILLRDDALELAEFTKALKLDANLALGVLTETEAGDLHNSLLVLNSEGALQAAYDKHRLVPFGEYVPFRGLLELIGFSALAREGFTPGSGPRMVQVPGLPPFAALVCFEAIFSGDVRRAALESSWILQVTNDAWFGPDAGPRQHFALAQARATELGVPLVRVANTGITGITDARGRVLAALEFEERGALTHVLPPPLRNKTFFARNGDTAFWLLVCAGVGWPFLPWLLRRKRSRDARL